MTSFEYRLLNDAAFVLESFTAEDTGKAEERARALSGRHIEVDRWSGAKNGFLLERHDGDTWRLVMAWAPG